MSEAAAEGGGVAVGALVAVVEAAQAAIEVSTATAEAEEAGLRTRQACGGGGRTEEVDRKKLTCSDSNFVWYLMPSFTAFLF